MQDFQTAGNSVNEAWLCKLSQNTAKQTLETSFYKTNLYSAPRFAQTWNDFSEFTKICFHFLRSFSLAVGSRHSTIVVLPSTSNFSFIHANDISHIQSISNGNWTEWSTIQGVIGRVVLNRPSA